jgi:aspartyl-tRNA(Asn)/glutamyl-tRNA(Gln) amidotransferase subunit A
VQLWELSAASAAEEMRRGRIAPRDYLNAHLDRIETTEPVVQAWEHIDPAAAIEQARALERMRPGERAGMLLFGLPMGIKDVIDVKGQSTSSDFAPYRNRAVASDAGIVSRLRHAGGIILGKTTTAQFAWGQDAPKTRNPWNLDHTPGASSAGSSAAVAARQIPIGIGTQTAGSGLRPAAYCGVVGLKPSYGRVSCYGVLPTSWSSDHPSFVARSVVEVAIALQATAGHDPSDPHSSRTPVDNYVDAASPVGRPRLGVLLDYTERAKADVGHGFDQALQKLAAAGADLIEVRLPASFDLIQAIHWAISTSEGAAIHSEQFAHHPEDYLPTVRERFEISQLIPAAAYVQAKRLLRRLRPIMIAMFAEVDAIVAPTSSEMAPRRDNNALSNRLGSSSFQVPSSCFGCPAISLPTGIGENNLPYGLQLITAPFKESILLRTAAWCETVLPMLPSVPSAIA